MSGKCASRTFPPPNNLPLDVNITASEKQNKSCLDFQANLPSFNATLVVHKSTLILSFVENFCGKMPEKM
jgi:hypothetical protein